MNFIFPKNYNFKPKLLGIIDYSTAILDSIVGILLFLFLNLLIKETSIKVYIFTSLFLPLLLISIVGFQNENFIFVFKYMYKYLKNQKVYLYNKNKAN